MRVCGLAGVKYNNAIYFSGYEPSFGLFEFHLKTGKTRKIMDFSNELGEGLYHTKAFLYRNEAWFVPSDAKHIHCVNLDTLICQAFPIVGCEFFSHAFMDCVLYGSSNLLLIPGGCQLRTLVNIDLESHEIKYYRDAIPYSPCMGAYLWNGVLYFLSYEGKVLSCMDSEEISNGGTYATNETIDMTLRSAYSDALYPRYSGIVQRGKEVYFIPFWGSDVGYINVDTGYRENIALPDTKEQFLHGCFLGNHVMMYPRDETERYLMLNLQTKEIVMRYFPKGIHSQGLIGTRNVCTGREDECITIGTDNSLRFFNANGELVKSTLYGVSVQDAVSAWHGNHSEKIEEIRGWRIVSENQHVSLTDFLEAVCE